jgi:hypothetical protein
MGPQTGCRYFHPYNIAKENNFKKGREEMQLPN